MKNKVIIILGIAIAIGITAFCIGRIEDGSNTADDSANVVKKTSLPLNISIYLDLSDRIKPDGTDKLSQKDKDMAIVEYLANHIKERAIKMKILPSKDRIKVFFYPQPADAKIALLSNNLELDLGVTPPKDKKHKIKVLEQEFNNSLEQIYSSTITTGNWIGSDIWGFFNKPIDNYCIKKDYRNILVVLTDGYIYYGPDQRSNGSAHNFILPSTLRDQNSSLIPGRTGLENIEVLMLELNPNPAADQPKMEQVINDWLKEMGVQKYYVGETDVTSNTKMIIDNFLKNV